MLDKTTLLKDSIEKSKKEKVFEICFQYTFIRRIIKALKFEIKTETILITRKQFIKNYKKLMAGQIPAVEIEQYANDNFDLYINEEYNEIDTRLLNPYIKPCEPDLTIKAILKETNEEHDKYNNEITANILNIKCIN